MLHLVVLALAALHAPLPADSQALPHAVAGIAHIDAATALAGPLAPSVVHLPTGKPGGTEVELYNENTRESLTLYLRFDGVTDRATADQLAEFFRCKRTGKKRTMDAGVVGLLAQLSSHYPGHVVEVVSGVRARGYGAKESKHYVGHAIDFRIRGVSTRELRDLAWSLNAEIGVGHYRGENFVHIDHRPGEHKIAWEQRRAGSKFRYHPGWAKGSGKALAPDTALAQSGHGEDEARTLTSRTERRGEARKARPARTLRSEQPRW